MEIEMIPLETELSTQTKKNPVSQRPMSIGVSFMGVCGEFDLVYYSNVLPAPRWLCE